MVINSVFIVSGAAGFASTTTTEKRHHHYQNWKSWYKQCSGCEGVVVVNDEDEEDQKKETRAWTSLFLIKTKPAAPALNRSTNWTSPIIGDDRQATLIHRLVEQKSISFDYLNFFPSTWRAIYFTPFGNYSIERQALLVRPFVWWRVAEKSLERSHLMVDWILLR